MYLPFCRRLWFALMGRAQRGTWRQVRTEAFIPGLGLNTAAPSQKHQVTPDRRGAERETVWGQMMKGIYFFCFSINKVKDCGWKVPPVVLVNKGCFSHQTFTLQSPWQWTPRELKMERGCPHGTSATPHPRVHLRRQDEKAVMLAPDSWGTYQRSDFRAPRLLRLSIPTKALNSLIWDVWFSLINSDLFMSVYLAFVAKLPSILAPHLSLRSSPLELSEMLCPRLRFSETLPEKM